MQKTSTRLADGRELIYYDRLPVHRRDYPDLRTLPKQTSSSRARYDPLTGEWVIIASHRQDRSFQPSAADCPLCPSRDGHPTEVPAPEYDVVVFQNRFPALTGALAPASTSSGASAVGATSIGASAAAAALTGVAIGAGGVGGAIGASASGSASASTSGDGDRSSPPGALANVPAARMAGAAHPARPSSSVLRSIAGEGRCEVICFSSDHDLSFADLTDEQARLVLDVWIDRTQDLAAYPGIEQVFCFENRGSEIGVTQTHPHGQIYAYPFATPRTNRMLDMTTSYRRRFGRNVFDDLLTAERADGSRIVAQNAHWLAFVPYAARWPYEVHLYPNRRHADLTGLDESERASFPAVYLDLLRRFDRLFDTPAPYIAAWHQAPAHDGGRDFALHLELFTNRRSSGKLKYLAGSEAGMDVFANDIAPEQAAKRLRSLAK
jgi:UDPglucose--hexose-1-phosphate uridylyltransferase